MKSVSKLALGVALALGGAALAAPAIAQEAKTFSYSAEERAAMQPVEAAIAAKNYAAANAALPAARAAAKGADAQYRVGLLQLEIGKQTQDQALQAQGIDWMINSGQAAATDLAALYHNQSAYAASVGDYKKAEAALTKLVEITPNDADAIARLAEVKHDLKKVPEAVALFDRAIQVRAASGQPAPQNWYKRALSIATANRLTAESMKFAQGLVAAYPTKVNWRDALLIYANLGSPDHDTALDLLRLMRASDSLAGERDYKQLAQAAMSEDLAGEAKAVIDEAIAARMIDPSKAEFRDVITAAQRKHTSVKNGLAARETRAMAAATGVDAVKVADAYYGYGDYAKAATLYRAALQKGSVDPGLVNTRLGMALALAGQKAEAEAAFKAVTGPRAPLAAYWLLWLKTPIQA